MTTKTSGAAAKRALPSKEASLFKELLTLYETRQLKKGLKTADQILKKFPEHGETLCMKGLVLAHMGKREEGIDLVKKGVRLDLSSHICWHVFGLIQKGEKNYEEALKSYTQALRYDKDNLNILRDAAQLQTQLRIYDGLVETRLSLLKLRPNIRQHWIALAVAYHLNGNLHDAKKILENYENMLKNVPDYDIEQSETYLYHIRLLEELGEFSEGLAILDVCAKSRTIVDRTAIMEYRARFLTKIKSDEAEHAWRSLIELNPDCYDYYHGYLRNQGLNFEKTPSESLKTLQEFSTLLPKANAHRRLALTIATGDAFKDLVQPYLLSGLAKGIPSLFADIKSLYLDKEKQQIVEDIVEAEKERLAAEGAADFSPSTPSEPTTYLWTLYFLAQHHSYLGRHTKALSILETSMSHTPTLPELHMCKGRVLKRAGDYLGAARCVNEARLLDGQDRFLNTKAAKYMLRAGLSEEANTILGLFTKKDAVSPGQDLEDMQSILYLLEEARTQNQAGKFNLALKKYMAINRIFGEIEDDQYDFHGYNLRKFTINIYLSLLTWADQLRSDPAYVTSAVAASKIFVAVYDDPKLVSILSSSNQLTDAEKKAKKKAKKAAQKVQEDPKKAPPTIEDKGLEISASKDDDPDGLKLLGASDPLERAAKILSPLSTLVPKDIDAWVAIFDVAIRRKKYLQALKALEHARALDGENPEVHIRIVDSQKAVSGLSDNQSPPVSIFKDALSKIIPDSITLETYNSQYLQHHTDSSKAILAVAKVLQKLGSPQSEIEDTIFTTLREESNLDIVTACVCLDYLNSIESTRTEEYRASCQSKFELSTVFKPAEELIALRQAVLAPITDERNVDDVVP